MAPKSGKPQKGKPAAEIKQEQPLQAVVLADSFETRFKPLTNEKPRCLLPLANIPIIEYTLEFLASNGVQEVIVYAGNHTDQLEEYLRQGITLGSSASKWKRRSSPFRELHIFKTAATCVGDFLRDLDSRDLVKGDFVVVDGDVVSNVELGPVLAKHKARREKDKNAIMTMVLREKLYDHPSSHRCRKPVFVLNPRLDRCLHYEEVGGRGASRCITLDPEFLTSNDEIEIREDLIDPHIDICTPDVLALWSDNFDFQSLRKSFLFGVLKDHELNGKTIHTHIVRNRYASRAATLKAYSVITKHVLGRMVFPLGPESNLHDDQDYQPTTSAVYRESSTTIAGSANVTGKCAIGKDTSIGDGSRILNSTLGRGCKLGQNVVLENTVVWDNVTIDENARIIGPAIIADGAQIGADSSILPGSVLESGVTVAKGSTVAGIKVARSAQGAQDGTEYVDDSDVSSEASVQLYSQPPSQSGSRSSISTFASSEDLGPDDYTSRRSSVISDRSDDAVENKDFVNKATADILEGLSNDDSPDAILLELNGFRMTVNASQHQVRHAVVSACLKRVVQLSGGGSAKGPVQTVLERCKPLLERMLFDKEAEDKADQADLLLLLQKEVVGKEKGDQLLLFATQQLYELDVVEEDGVLQWWEDPRSQTEELSGVRALTQPFVTWLKETEDSDESEEEDEESE